MKYEQKFKDFVEKWIAEYIYDVFAEEYNHRIIWEENDKIRDDKDENLTDASAMINDTYLYFIIKIYPALQEEWMSGNYSAVKYALLHEVCHLFTRPLVELSLNLLNGKLETPQNINRVEERQTQRITNSIDMLTKLIDEKDREIKKLKNHSRQSGKSH